MWPGFDSGLDATWWLNLLVFHSALRASSLGTPIFSSPQNPTLDEIWEKGKTLVRKKDWHAILWRNRCSGNLYPIVLPSESSRPRVLGHLADKLSCKLKQLVVANWLVAKLPSREMTILVSRYSSRATSFGALQSFLLFWKTSWRVSLSRRASLEYTLAISR